MTNIYGQSEQERNSIVQIPQDLIKSSGNTLYSWLGSLWRSLNKGDDLVRGLQEARGVRLAQLYIDILEAVKLQDRNGAPVFHRELWHPIVIRRSQRNKAQDNMLVIGGDERKIGPQPSGSLYGEGTVFQVGRMANFEDYVTYPIDTPISGGALSIVDNIINPKVSMTREFDFEIRNSTIIFHKDNDPLDDDSLFERYDLPNIIQNSDGSLGSDIEAVLWASDVLIDKNYISDHLSYALGASFPSTDVAKRILNAAWSSTTCGLTVELIQTLLAAMLNIPVIQHSSETVTDITLEKDSEGNAVSRLIYTDLGVYRISLKAKILKSIHVGSVLSRGSLLDESLRIYPYLNVPSAYETQYSVPVEQDVPSIELSKSILRARTEFGVYAMWERSVVKKDKTTPYDKNGNPRLYFDVGGRKSDVDAFWNDIWQKAEENNVSMSDIVGDEGSLISPASFVLRHLVGANTIFIVIDKTQADDTSMMRNPMFFDMLSSVIPSAIRLFLVEHRLVGEDDRMDLGAAKETHFMAAAMPNVTESVSENEDPILRGRNPSYGERVSVKLIRPTPVKKRGKKEET